MKKMLGTSIVSSKKFEVHIKDKSAGFICNRPALLAFQDTTTIAFIISDFNTLNGFLFEFKFAKEPKNEKAWHGAVKILAREVLRTLKNENVTSVAFFTMGRKISAALKSGISYLQKMGVQIL